MKLVTFDEGRTGRVDGDTVRTGAERATVVLEIAPDPALRARCASAGFTLADDDDLIVQREVDLALIP